MPKKIFDYKQFGPDIWYTESLKGWFIVKEKDLFVVKKGTILNKNSIEFGSKIFKSYLRLGDAKTGMERFLKEKTSNIQKQESLFKELQKLKPQEKKESVSLDYNFLNAEAERLKKKWGLK